MFFALLKPGIKPESLAPIDGVQVAPCDDRRVVIFCEYDAQRSFTQIYKDEILVDSRNVAACYADVQSFGVVYRLATNASFVLMQLMAVYIGFFKWPSIPADQQSAGLVVYFVVAFVLATMLLMQAVKMFAIEAALTRIFPHLDHYTAVHMK